ncbi:hypothetical protein HZP65_12130 [Elizabethkingia anophelis]|uniref:hypothetical protein n=1 Tax=Elizabethkingia anophelis TaxID=1117645 RepID=UPI00063AB338|nr:hypothetical protein [Elizabethkingia anophelis]AKH95548.1 hypothetical protein M876_13320 [Elizabethkingia anophelis FMS-007]MCT3898406.1 hypothetical protein [Elizabethkingia anophelis]MCT4124287.1 hypothetical protein [Elizabethkingia anophelis]MCT4141482.1 hypothetical protein [Elizabethkingia anophelis]MCT4277088.1 hypothetical protein [Elizabethkingia anophelis]
MAQKTKNSNLKKNRTPIEKIEFLPKPVLNKLNEAIVFNPPQFDINRMLAVFFLSLILSVPAKDRKLEVGRDRYVPLFSGILQTYSKDYNKYFDYFIDNGIVEYINYNTRKKKSYSYRFSVGLIPDSVDLVAVDLISLANKVQRKKFIVENTSTFDHLSKWLNPKLTIDRSNALEKIKKVDDINETKYMHYNYTIEKLCTGNFYAIRDIETDNRLHTNITNLPKIFRPFLRYEGEKLYSRDICTSQPFFLVYLIEYIYLYRDIPCKESINLPIYTLMLEKLCNCLLTEGFRENYEKLKDWILHDDIYNELGELLFPDQDAEKLVIKEYSKAKNLYVDVEYKSKRDAMKVITLTIFYSTLRTRNPQVKKFKQLFPNFYKLLSLLKQDDYKNFPKILQHIEANCIIDFVTKKLSIDYPKMPLFTIHDSIMTTESYRAILDTEMPKLISEYCLGLKPQIKD